MKKILLAVAALGLILVAWTFVINPNTAIAGEITDFEVGLKGDVDFSDLEATSIEPTVYMNGELDLDYAVVDWSANYDVTTKDELNGEFGAYYRVYKKGNVELLAGVAQPYDLGENATFSDTRTWKVRIRKPY
jgi:hypothetical protein